MVRRTHGRRRDDQELTVLTARSRLGGFSVHSLIHSFILHSFIPSLTCSQRAKHSGTSEEARYSPCPPGTFSGGRCKQ